jgi:hypothetical protein
MKTSLESVVRQARTQPLTPTVAPPDWMDFDRVRLGFDFRERHSVYIQQIMATSGLGSIFACRDLIPVVMHTGVLPYDFSNRMNELLEYMDLILRRRDRAEEFVATSLAWACRLGRTHVEVARQIEDGLGWDRSERVPINQQAFTLSLYGYLWWPIEALVATGQIDPEEPSAELESWFHLWAILGRAIGICEALLPAGFAEARETVTLLRAAQYTSAGEDLPEGIPILLGGQVRWIAEKLAAQSGIGALAPEMLLASAAGAFAHAIKLSPGLTEALGLGGHPAGRLMRYALAPISKEAQAPSTARERRPC